METAPPHPLPPPPPPPPPPAPALRLTRSNDDKVIAGVCGGLGRHFGVDPVIFRIAFVVLSLAGAAGFLLYIVGWLLIPDDTGATVFQRMGKTRWHKLFAGVAGGLGLAFFVHELVDDWGPVSFGVVLIAAGGMVLWFRRRETPPGYAGPSGPTGDPAPAGPPVGVAMAPPVPEVDVDTLPLHMAPPAPPAPPPPEGRAAALPPRPAKPPKPRKPSSVLTPVALCLLAILVGVLALLNAAGTVDVSPAAGIALALVLLGGALIVGAWWGRAKGLIPVAALLALALPIATMVDVPLRGGIGDRDYRPESLASVDSPYRLAIGELTLDLRRLAPDLSRVASSVRVEATVGIGHLRVVVPDGVHVDAELHSGAGNVQVMGSGWDGTDIDRRVMIPGREGGGRIVPGRHRTSGGEPWRGMSSTSSR